MNRRMGLWLAANFTGPCRHRRMRKRRRSAGSSRIRAVQNQIRPPRARFHLPAPRRPAQAPRQGRRQEGPSPSRSGGSGRPSPPSAGSSWPARDLAAARLGLDAHHQRARLPTQPQEKPEQRSRGTSTKPRRRRRSPETCPAASSDGDVDGDEV
ncbi:hypothetical protein BRADI_4g34729v3 [Brachypodium distachyon]|uniref:Uncharacterized protein n=1 Tax=Brachypodium distachyon TaxID=15368 RepID=A0A2K2CS97_BRADI|nr:hypothetical protein BRADI_4g34729v3 [Brachypodium distachyon]